MTKYKKMKTFKINFPVIIACACAIVIGITLQGCKKYDEKNLNSPSVSGITANATLEELNNVVTGTESEMRENYYFYIDDCGIIGREFYRFSNSDPRYTQDLLGGGNSSLDANGFYTNNPWGSRYRCVKNCNILITAATNSSFANAGEKKGYIAFAKTIKALELLYNLNMTNNKGIRIDVNDPLNLGPFVSKAEALSAIVALLEEAQSELVSPDCEFFFHLSSGFSGFDDPAGFLQFNYAISSRVALYRQQWSQALSEVNKSFLDLSGNLNKGVYMAFSTSTNDQLNNLFFPLNASGEIRVAHPSYATDIESGDDRINKVPMRNDTVTLSDLSSDRDVQVYSSSTDNVGVIRNEELILIYAEANIQLNNISDALNAINLIRTSHNLGAYSGGTTQPELINEMLKQRRYSLFFEGHRWIDMRRYNKLGELPIDRTDDNVWEEFPIPFAEGQ